MKNESRLNSGRGNRFALFLLFARFMNDRIARCLPRAEALGTSRRFSTWLARTDGCANHVEKRRHDPTDLPWSHRATFRLPRQQCSQAKGACKIHLRKSQGHDPTPAQKLLGGANTRGKPEQILFQKAEKMLFRETQAVALWHLLQGDQRIQSEKPTHARITLGATCPGAFDADHRKDQVAILLEMHFLEAADLRPFALLIGGLPSRRWITLRFWTRPLQKRPILRRTAKPEAAHWLAIELAVPFQADQHAAAQVVTGSQHFGRPLPTLRDAPTQPPYN